MGRSWRRSWRRSGWSWSWRRLGRWLGVAFVVASFGFWVWAFSPWARSENPARLDDRAFVGWSERRCSETQSAIGALPSPRQADTLAQRADQVDAGTQHVARLVADLRSAAEALPLTTPGDGPPDSELVAKWFADWDLYVSDRRAHAAKLRSADEHTPDRDLRFLLSDVVGGGIYTERMDGFARLNNMDACGVPGDV